MATFPTVHLNGTSQAELSKGYEDVYDALENAYQRLKQTAPNGRDYYLQNPNGLKSATDEHMARLRKIDEIKAEIEALIGHVTFSE